MAYSSAVAISVTNLTRDGVEITTLPTTPTATHGNKFLYTRDAFLIVHNGSGAQITVTLDITRAVDGQTVTDRTVTVDAGDTKIIGPFNDDYAQADGYIWATFSAVTDITIGAYRVP